jgi:hypothetical protein
MKYVNTLNEFSSNSEFEPEKVYPAEDYFVSFVTGMGEEDTQKVYGPFTGKRGRIQGASTVRIPAINEINRSNILF